MESRKKRILEVLFLVLVFGGTMYGVFHDEDLGQIFRIIKNVRKIDLLSALLCVVAFIWGESIIIHYLMKTLNIRVGRSVCFLFSSIGFFYSCITPSASGGQPAQIYYMRRENIPIPVATMVLIVVTIAYKVVLVIFGIGMLLFGQGFMQRYLAGILPVFCLGIILNVLCVGFMLMLVYHTTLAGNFLHKGLTIVEKLHFVHRMERLHERVKSGMEKYQETSVYFKTHYGVLLRVLLLTFLQRIALFLSTYFVYRSFGLHTFSITTIVLLQAAISISVDMLPLPGGMGISETLFLNIFAPVFGTALILPGMVLSRGFSYYTELFLCAILMIVAHYVLGRKKQ